MLRRIHGGDHSDVATSLCHLALVYEAQGQLDYSEALQEESLAMLRRIHADQDHKSVATSLRHLAHLYKAQGRMPESESLEAESLAMLQRIHANRDHNDAGV